MDAKRELLRHTVATLAYRGGKAVREAPEGFAATRALPQGRSALEIVAHIGDLLEWALWLAKGQHKWRSDTPQSWDAAVKRFFEGLQRFDDYLASEEPLGNPPEKLFQGPIADALNHVGQIAVLRRIAGSPVRGENYYRAEIVIGRVGTEQSSKRVEFD